MEGARRLRETGCCKSIEYRKMKKINDKIRHYKSYQHVRHVRLPHISFEPTVGSNRVVFHRTLQDLILLVVGVIRFSFGITLVTKTFDILLWSTTKPLI